MLQLRKMQVSYYTPSSRYHGHFFLSLRSPSEGCEDVGWIVRMRMYSGCRTKAYATMSKGIMVTVVLKPKVFQHAKRKQPKHVYSCSLFFLLKNREPKSGKDKLSLSIGIVAYALMICGTTVVEAAACESIKGESF